LIIGNSRGNGRGMGRAKLRAKLRAIGIRYNQIPIPGPNKYDNGRRYHASLGTLSTSQTMPSERIDYGSQKNTDCG